MGDVLVARETFVCNINGKRCQVNEGDLVRAGHPVTKGREHLFGEPDVLEYERPAPKKKVAPKTEQATAAPGEVRELSNSPTVSDES